MEERTILAVILSLIVILIYYRFFAPQPPPPVVEQPKVKEDSLRQRLPSATAPSSGSNDTFVDQEIAKLLEEQKNEKPRDIVVETEKYRAVINTDGAIITSWKLKDYYLTEDYENSPLNMNFWKKVAHSYKRYFTTLFKPSGEKRERDNIDLFQFSPADGGYGLKLMAGSGCPVEEAEKPNLYSGVFRTEAQNITLNSSHPRETIRLTRVMANGFQVDKIFTFHHDSFQIEVEVLATNLKESSNTFDYSLLLGPGLGNAFQKGPHKYEGPVSWLDGKKIKDKPGKNVVDVQHQGHISWTAMTSNYFMAAIIPQREESEISICRPKIATKGNINQSTIIGLHYPARQVAAKAREKDIYKLYFGPKDYKILKSLGFNLEQAVDYGFFSPLAKPLIWLLNWFYRLIPNYGVAIILLTLLIKIIFWPLTNKSFRSMKEMQELQPKLTELKEKYKNDPKKLNEELMNMYKAKGINPMGGCLPLLLQIPVFFALYEGLLVSIELRGAPFILWIKDLSTMDPLLITPILMGLTMYIQQKMTPMSGEATQVKMMTMMPLIFTIFFLGFPSGLVIYWLLNNLFTIGQHYLILKKMEGSA
ncbi:MAG: membrane protein insertase YidC [bacterium]|nr:membrane protein insertase YidC [bacterium]